MIKVDQFLPSLSLHSNGAGEGRADINHGIPFIGTIIQGSDKRMKGGQETVRRDGVLFL